MSKAIRILICLYLFSISWVESYNVLGWFRIHVIISLLIIPLTFNNLIIGKKFFTTIYKKEDYFLVLLLIGLLISYMINPNSHSKNFLMAYFFIFFIELLFLKGVFYNYIEKKTIYNTNTIAILFVCAFVVSEFFLEAFFGFDIQSIFPREKVARGGYLGGRFSRSYGFCTEPTILAFYLNTLGPIALFNIYKSNKITVIIKIIITVLYAIALLSTFSGSGLFLLPVSIILSILLVYKSRLRIFNRRAYLYSSAILLIIMVAIINFKEIKLFFNPITTKVTLQQERYSRPQKWVEGIKNLVKKPFFGMGIGAYSAMGRGSSINWYLTLSEEGGIISSAPVIIFLIYCFLRIKNSNLQKGEKFTFMVGFLAGALHLFTISTFFHPFLWVLITIFYNSDGESNKNRYYKSLYSHRNKLASSLYE